MHIDTGTQHLSALNSHGSQFLITHPLQSRLNRQYTALGKVTPIGEAMYIIEQDGRKKMVEICRA